MNTYGFYVWGAYGLAFILCTGITVTTLWERSRLQKRLKGKGK